MSEERRKRKQERAGGDPSERSPKKMFTWGAIVLLLVGAYLAFWYHQNHKYDAFAKCLSTKDAKMYGLYWCPHCIERKGEFGDSFFYVNYFEFATKGANELNADN